MSDFEQCIANGLTEGEITPDRAEKILDLYRGYLDEFTAQLPDGSEAKRRAARAAFNAAEAEAGERRRLLRLTEQASRRIQLEMDGYRTLKGKSDFGEAMKAYFWDDSAAAYQNVQDQFQAVRGLAHAEMADAVLTFQRDLIGRTRNPKLVKDMVRELFGENSNNPKAKILADQWENASEKMRTLFNASGGSIGKLERWGAPQRHDPAIFRRTTFDDWRNFVVPRLDRSKMIDDLTGEPLSGARLELALKDMFDAVSSDGWSRRTPSRGGGGVSTARKYQHERFLKFKDANAWTEYQEAFGAADIWQSMTNHIDGLAKDIAAMQIFGPNPSATIRWMEDLVNKQASVRPKGMSAKAYEKQVTRAKQSANVSRTMWKHYTGEINEPGNFAVSDFGQSVRTYLTGTLLGSTTLVAAPTDLASQMAARRFAGMKQTGIIRDLVKLLNPKSDADRAIAIRSGLVADHATSQGLAAARFTGENGIKGVSAQYADTALRLTGLSQITQAGRWSMGMEWMGHLADLADRPFKDLPEGTQRVLRRHGLEAQWDTLRRAPIDTEPGKRLITPRAIAQIPGLTDAQADALSLRYLAGIQSEMEFAVPTGTLRSRAFLASTAPPGTLAGELSRSFAMFKSFPAAISFMHGRRTLQLLEQYGAPAGVRYVAAVVASFTMAGALAMQLQQIALGRDPMPMTSRKFWGSAALKGGGLGIWGDFLFASENAYGQGIETTFAGPVAGALDDTLDLTVGNINAIAQGEDPKLGRDLVKTMRNYTPFGRTFYARLAYERMLLDQLQEAADPQASRDFRRRIRRAQRDQGQDYYWAPGEAVPDRPPDLTAAISEE